MRGSPTDARSNTNKRVVAPRLFYGEELYNGRHKNRGSLRKNLQ